ncbi:3-alpha,7-alpha,12-alpha-trihydroxy-5-beta-cholest-24-enoyl-CoA hydratase [Oleomonas cavernae]|uniref:3-alpha,7-alpha, 12-alpha-trihydroxy-5-beta-cholest-24-enoyl-CoA hydratase n=1 Tax=Oleomonas cavernae TaxID=2320859 RepID=A0A418WHN6_9PROT|nr:MaoC/PaaZ C-terminal domain-containing protein [Oleomonas cavernae]RJF89409.1 3-alpha,7-alpha,12-alpha-trihydroxy-5-beta-cholest-24-enoyl-CoA hydratase [Oleomonas cavernae]
MAIDSQQLLSWRFPQVAQHYSKHDAILYALGVGLGADPLDPTELAFLLESGLRVLPTMAVTLSTLGMWVREPALGIDWVRLVHSAQDATFHAPLPGHGDVVADARIVSVADRGAGKGAVVTLERLIKDAATQVPYCTVTQTLLLRGDGGFGGPPPAPAATPALPSRTPDVTLAIQTSPRAALIYRLSGDLNPLHADPAVAAKAGFARPILHGLASYGMAGWAVLRAFGGGEPAALRRLAVRFAGIVLPGDRLDFRLWLEGAQVLFAARVGDRTVLDQGVAELDAGPH